MNSSVMRRDGCSLKTEFIRAILAALRLASALVGQNWEDQRCYLNHTVIESWRCSQNSLPRDPQEKTLDRKICTRRWRPNTQLFIFRKIWEKCIGESKGNVAWGACLKTPEAASPGETDVADVRRVVGWDHLVDHKSAVPQVGTPWLLHLPELL